MLSLPALPSLSGRRECVTKGNHLEKDVRSSISLWKLSSCVVTKILHFVGIATVVPTWKVYGQEGQTMTTLGLVQLQSLSWRQRPQRSSASSTQECQIHIPWYTKPDRQHSWWSNPRQILRKVHSSLCHTLIADEVTKCSKKEQLCSKVHQARVKFNQGRSCYISGLWQSCYRWNFG